MKYYISVLKNYATFSGRATRSEYWYFILFNLIFSIAASVLDKMFGTRYDFDDSYYSTYGYASTSVHIGYINLLYTLAVLIPSLAVLVRRLHDTGKSGWYALLLFLPIIGWIWLLVLLCIDSEVGENKYGPNPYGIGNQSIDEIGSYLTK
jgi:uncharacterized membrane protein YhaH (DUF805 family)